MLLSHIDGFVVSGRLQDLPGIARLGTNLLLLFRTSLSGPSVMNAGHIIGDCVEKRRRPNLRETAYLAQIIFSITNTALKFELVGGHIARVQQW